MPAELQRQLEDQAARVAELELAHAELGRQLAQRDANLRELEAALAKARMNVLRLEAELAEARARTAATVPDDLKVLRGVGPSMERALHSLGVRHLEQIAAWTQQDVYDVAAKLGSNPERILRYDWIGGAQEELQLRAVGGGG